MKRPDLFVAIAALLLGVLDTSAQVDRQVQDAQAARVAVMAEVSPAVLAIFSPSGGGGGSGVVISADGYALSNYHVTAGIGPAMKCGMSDGRLYDAVIVGIDPTGDVALLKLLGADDFPYVKMGDSDQVLAGDWVFAMGNPFLLATDFQPTVTYGIVSGVHRYQFPSGTLLEYCDCIQIDASINPGNSGGPLFNAQGELIGINGRGSFEKRGRVNVGAAYAISINQIRNFLGHLKSGRVVDHATLGAVASSDDLQRVVATEVQTESDAYRRGLDAGDEIRQLAGRPIHTVNGLKNVLGIYPKGWRVPLSYRRDGDTYEALVRLRGVHRTGELWEKISRRPSRERRPRPNPDRPKDDPPPQDRRRQPRTDRRRVAMPELVKSHYEARDGYANYFFNRLERERVGTTLTETGDFSQLGGEWSLKGRDLGGESVELLLGNESLSFSLPNREVTLDLTDDISAAVEPAGSGGLLSAMAAWRRLLLYGPERFGEMVYLGTAPLADYEVLVDVLVGVHLGVESHFYVDPTTGRLLALELFTSEDADPCEVYFGSYDEVEGRFLPGQIEVRYGDGQFGVYEFDQITLEPGDVE